MPSLRRPLALAAAVIALAAAADAAAQSVQLRPVQVVVDAADVSGLETRLQALAGALPADQRQLLHDLLRRAAGAPADNPAGTTVRPVYFAPGAARGIIVQGGRTAGVPGRPGVEEIGPKQDDPRALGTGAVAIGPKQDDPRAPRTGAVAIGPKQDDPGAPRPTGVHAIGPKQDDPRTPQGALSVRLAELSGALPVSERAALDWLMQRAASGHGTPGGLQPGRVPSLAQALGIAPVAIGPKQDDPAPPPPASTRWVLRF